MRYIIFCSFFALLIGCTEYATPHTSCKDGLALTGQTQQSLEPAYGIERLIQQGWNTMDTIENRQPVPGSVCGEWRVDLPHGRQMRFDCQGNNFMVVDPVERKPIGSGVQIDDHVNFRLDEELRGRHLSMDFRLLRTSPQELVGMAMSPGDPTAATIVRFFRP